MTIWRTSNQLHLSYPLPNTMMKMERTNVSVEETKSPLDSLKAVTLPFPVEQVVRHLLEDSDFTLRFHQSKGNEGTIDYFNSNFRHSD